ncbi:cysteine--tRNA ligase [Candidatus Microgenomates bacterium]|nr:MAG: cysteine--tRNA ligase [Candidatus Microgenomates bacterium]
MKLYNSLSKKIEDFIPLKNNEVKMYVCGITPYDTTHLGHAFTYIFFDVLLRYLTFKEYKVTYTQNVTDIDDDILKRAKLKEKDWKELGEFWTNKFLNDLKSLNVLPPTYYVKATGSIALMIRIIRVLIEKDFAYEREGNVYFNENKFKDYGELSGLNKHQMIIISKQRGGDPTDPLKENPLDFLLWKKSKEDEPFWESPWGKGRPGWHIECSAMIRQYLGEQIDIHGGGRDLIFPHHESEIAQSESATEKKPFVKFWMHTAMVMYQGEKMAKSLGNLVMVSDLLKTYSADTIRFVLLSHCYRLPWEFMESEMEPAEKIVSKINKALIFKDSTENKEEKNDYEIRFNKIMDDDMDTPQALQLISSLADEIIENKINIESLQKTLKKLLLILGFSLE